MFILLNFYYTGLTYLLGSTVYYHLTHSHNTLLGYFNYLDNLNRLKHSEFFINTYYYWWTTFYYIPLTFLILYLYVLTLESLSQLRVTLTSLVIIIIVNLYGLNSYWLTNPLVIDTVITSELLNSLLLNSINKYHPMVLYFIIAFVTSNFITHLTVFWGESYVWDTTHNIRSRESFGYRLLYITMTLFLGSWWALQEGSWGGWWNWDASEVFGLLIMVTLALTLHRSVSTANYYLYFMVLRLYLYSLLGTYFFIQLNFSLISHNFGLKPTQILHPLQFNTTLLTLLLGSVLWLVKCTWSHTTIYYNRLQLLIRSINIYELPLFVVYSLTMFFIILYSFLPLINDFTWKFFSVHILVVGYPIRTILILTLITLILTGFKGLWVLNPSLLLWCLVYWYSLYALLLINPLTSHTLTILHKLPLFFMIATLMSGSKILNHWLLTQQHFYLSSDNYFIDEFDLLLSATQATQKISTFVINGYATSHWASGLITTATTSDINFLVNYMMKDVLLQSLGGNYNTTLYHIMVSDFTLLPLLLLFILGVCSVIYTFFTKMLIVY